MINTCGVCNCEVRLYTVETIRGPERQWRHPNPDKSVGVHRAILGVPAPPLARVFRPTDVEETQDDEEEVLVDDVPPPEVPQRPALEEEIVKGARDLIRVAEKEGLGVESLFARGTWPTRGGKVVEILAVRFVRGDNDRAVATWKDGKMHRCYIVRPATERINAVKLRAWIKA